MKNRMKALLLACALTAGMLTMSMYAAETATEGALETLTESVEEQSEVAGADAGSVSTEDYINGQIKMDAASLMEQLSSMTDEQLNHTIENDEVFGGICANWMNVKKELGIMTDVGEQEVTVSEDGNTYTVVSHPVYDGVPDKTEVIVTNTYDMTKQTRQMEWDIKYPMSKLIAEAGLNTLLGLGIVFIVLIFLSFVISQIHWIPDLVEKRNNKQVPEAQPQVAQTAPAAVEEPEEELSDDEELVAVIAAAIAAYEQTSTDGFVVRSIKKANRKSWVNA